MPDHEPLGQLIPRYTPALLTELRALAESGQRIRAIHELRASSGMGLRWCQDFVQALSVPDTVAITRLTIEGHLPAAIELQARTLLARGQHAKARQIIVQCTAWGSETIDAYLHGLARTGHLAYPDAN